MCAVHSHSLHLEFLEVGATFLSRRSHDIQEVWREHEGNPLLTDPHKTLVVAQDVAKVDVEEVSCRNTKGFVCFVHAVSSFLYISVPNNRMKIHLVTRFCDHYVVIVAIPDTQDVGGHTVATAGIQKPLHGLLELHTETETVCHPVKIRFKQVFHKTRGGLWFGASELGVAQLSVNV